MTTANQSNLTETIRAEYKFVHEDAKLPFRKRETDAGYDIYSIEDVVVPPHGMANVRTGIIIAVPYGYYFTVDGRSGIAMEGVVPFRGTIDATYCGELKVALENISDTPYYVKKHDRIAQIVLHRQLHMDFTQVETFSPEYNQRGTAGFGSSGK